MSEYDVSAMMISRQGPPPSYARTRLASSVARRPRYTPSRPSAPPWTGCGAGSTRPRAPPPAERGGGGGSRVPPGGPQCFRTNSGRDTGCCCCCRCCLLRRLRLRLRLRLRCRCSSLRAAAGVAARRGIGSRWDTRLEGSWKVPRQFLGRGVGSRWDKRRAACGRPPAGRCPTR